MSVLIMRNQVKLSKPNKLGVGERDGGKGGERGVVRDSAVQKESRPKQLGLVNEKGRGDERTRRSRTLNISYLAVGPTLSLAIGISTFRNIEL